MKRLLGAGNRRNREGTGALNEVGARVARYRRQAHLTQAELAARTGMHVVPLCDIENGRHLPSLPVLYRLAQELRVSADVLLGTGGGEGYVVQPAGVPGVPGGAVSAARTATLVRFPGEPALDPAALERVNAVVDIFLSVEDLCGAQKQANIPLDMPLPRQETGLEGFAARVRQLLGVGAGVIFDYVELLENAGLRVVFLDLPKGVESAAAHDPANRNAFIFISTAMTVERQLFRLAAELGRIYGFAGVQPGPLSAGLKADRAAGKFAAFFLMPAEAVMNTVRQTGVRPDEWSEDLLIRLKHRFGVSAEAFLYRLEELGLIHPARMKALKEAIHAHYCKTGNREPGASKRILTPNGRLGDLLHMAAQRPDLPAETAHLRKRLAKAGVEV